MHGAVGHARAAGLDLDQGLEPQKAARAVADELDGDSASARLRHDGLGGPIGADTERCRIARHVDFHVRSRLCVISASKRSGVMRPCNCSSIMSEGPRAQLPKQYTGSSVIEPSLVVP